jgi:multiple sugar transport system ATP-binding protein
MAQVILKDVTKRFGRITAVSDFDLSIKDREFIVLVGPSGCGKSTTLRMVAGLESVTEGEVHIGDRLVNNIPPKSRNIAMVFQNYALYPHKNVYQNMAFGLKLRRRPKEEIDKRVKEAATILGIEDLLNRRPDHLSGGQRQRVALGRAIVRQPEVFLFDEPLSNLDAKLRVHMRAELIRLHERLKTTMVYVTHDQVEAMTMGDRIVIMKDGVIQQVGTPLEVFRQPRNLFVAGFIGSPAINLFDCHLIQEDSNLYIKTSGFTLRVPEEKTMVYERYVGRPVVFGIRPEYIYDPRLSPARLEDNTIPAMVDVLEPLGSEVIIYFKINGQSLVGKLDANTEATSGQNLDIYLDMSKMHLFDPRSGELIQ